MDHIDLNVPPSGTGCAECLATDDGWWFHLRRCAQCGHVGCCDSSPSQHASRHAATESHPVAQSFEPGEDWFWDYTTAASVASLRRPRRPSSSSRVPSWLHRIITRSTSPSRDRLAACHKAGSGSCTECPQRSAEQVWCGPTG